MTKKLRKRYIFGIITEAVCKKQAVSLEILEYRIGKCETHNRLHIYFVRKNWRMYYGNHR